MNENNYYQPNGGNDPQYNNGYQQQNNYNQSYDNNYNQQQNNYNQSYDNNYISRITTHMISQPMTTALHKIIRILTHSRMLTMLSRTTTAVISSLIFQLSSPEIPRLKLQ